MRPLELDLLKDEAAPPWVGMALLGSGIAAAIGIGAQYAALGERVARAESSLHDSARTARKKPLVSRLQADPQKVALEFQQALDVMLRLQLPWHELFGSIESARNANVALLSIESEHDKRRVKIYAEAKDLEAMQREVAELRQAAARPLQDARRSAAGDLAAFSAFFPVPDELPEILATVFRAAKRQSLALERGKSRAPRPAAGGMFQYQLTFP